MITESSIRKILDGEVRFLRGTPAVIAREVGHSAIQPFRTDAFSGLGIRMPHDDTARFVGRMTSEVWGDLNQDEDLPSGWRVMRALVTVALEYSRGVPNMPETACRPVAYWYAALVSNRSTEGSQLVLPEDATSTQSAIVRREPDLIWTVEYGAMPDYEDYTALAGLITLSAYPDSLPSVLPVLDDGEGPVPFAIPPHEATVQEQVYVPNTGLVVAALKLRAGPAVEGAQIEYLDIAA
ncbi:MAG TPA: hypothetical protein VMB52_00150 [Verrucomicrobiae bacterium]|nr:hypothetical protein [Verrucomicrobiae bacterium]